MKHPTKFARTILGGTAALLALSAIVLPGGAVAANELPASATSEPGVLIFNHSVKAGTGAKYVTGDCGPGRYLDVNKGTPGMKVGQGFEVEEEDWFWTDVVEATYPSRTIVPHPAGGGAVQAMRLEITNNLILSSLWVRITMFCTSDPGRAWRG